jgi:hypothetical protein
LLLLFHTTGVLGQETELRLDRNPTLNVANDTQQTLDPDHRMAGQTEQRDANV